MRRPSARTAWAIWAGLCLVPSLACNFGRATPVTVAEAALTPIPYQCNIEVAPTEADRLHAENYAGATFDGNGWKKQILTSSQRVNVSWLSSQASGVAALEYDIFGCSYTPANIADMYRDQIFIYSIFADYEDVQALDQCSAGNTTLRTFRGDYEQVNYQMWHWLVQESDTRLLKLVLVFPSSQPDTMTAYAEALFPDLSACPAE